MEVPEPNYAEWVSRKPSVREGCLLGLGVCPDWASTHELPAEIQDRLEALIDMVEAELESDRRSELVTVLLGKGS